MSNLAQPTGLYGWIRSNDGRSIGLFLGFLVAIQFIAPLVLVGPLLLIDADRAPFFNTSGYFLVYAPIVLFGSMIWFAAQLWWHVETVKRAVDFHFVDESDEPRLCRVIEPLIILTGLPVPFVGVIESDARNAFACGIGRKKAVVVVTRGLIDSLDDDELASVLAHELSHIRNGDIRLMAAANIFMSALTKLHARNALRFTWVHGLMALAVPAVLPLSLAGSIIGRLALRGGQVSRLLIASSREFIADAESAQWTKNPAALASALLKVDGRHRVSCARAEDDAMMIAGDSEGTGATHPTIALRVAALARVTGSMVFNAPSAPRDADWTVSTPKETVERLAFGRRQIATNAIARVRKGDKENFLGLTFGGTVALMATLGALVVIHESDLGNPQRMLAKFDPRPIAILIGTPVACQLSPFSATFRQRCEAGLTQGAFQAFEGQSGTLAGFVADLNRKRRDRARVGPSLSPTPISAGSRYERYLGQSGRVRGVMTMKNGNSDLYFTQQGTFSSAPPEALFLAEIRQVGCFPGGRVVGSGQELTPLTQTSFDGWSATRLRDDAERLALDATVASSTPASAVDYLERREAMVSIAFDVFGRPGLDYVQALLAQPAHIYVITKLREELKLLPGGAISQLQQAKLKALLADPAAFVPCRSISSSVTRAKVISPDE